MITVIPWMSIHLLPSSFLDKPVFSASRSIYVSLFVLKGRPKESRSSKHHRCASLPLQTNAICERFYWIRYRSHKAEGAPQFECCLEAHLMSVPFVLAASFRKRLLKAGRVSAAWVWEGGTSAPHGLGGRPHGEGLSALGEHRVTNSYNLKERRSIVPLRTVAIVSPFHPRLSMQVRCWTPRLPVCINEL
jgi:hypothetical protein